MMIYRMLCFLAGLASLWQGEAFIKTIPKTSFPRSSTLCHHHHEGQNHFLDTKKVFQSFLGAIMITAFTAPITSPWPVIADARLNAPSAAGTRVNSDPESLLRYGLPIDNKEIRDIQAAVESAKMNLKTRRDAYAMSDVNKARSLINKYDTKILNDVPAEHKDVAKDTIAQIKEDFAPLVAAINAESSAGPGSVQERKGNGFDNACLHSFIMLMNLLLFRSGRCFCSTRKACERYWNLRRSFSPRFIPQRSARGLL